MAIDDDYIFTPQERLEKIAGIIKQRYLSLLSENQWYNGRDRTRKRNRNSFKEEPSKIK